MLEAFVDLNKNKEEKVDPKDKGEEREYLTDLESAEIHNKEKYKHEILRLTTETNNLVRGLVKLYFDQDLNSEEEKREANRKIDKEIESLNESKSSDKVGIKNAFQVAIYYLENRKGKENEKLVSNDYLDAFRKVDYIKLVYEKDTDNILETYFIQVKSREMKNEAELNRIISERINVGNTEYNESEKFYILKAQEMYKELENKDLRDKGKMYLDDKEKNKIFEEIRKSKLRNRKREILNRPDTEESIFASYQSLLLESKIKYKNQAELNKRNLESLDDYINVERKQIADEINEDLFYLKPRINLEAKSQKYLEVFSRTIMPIFEIKDKSVRMSRIIEYYKTYSFKKEYIREEEFNIWLELSEDILEKVYSYLEENIQIFQKYFDSRKKEKEAENKANIINSKKFYGVIAFPKDGNHIVEKVKELV